MPTSKQKHLRIVCPHCGKNISLAPPRTRLGFVKPVPCPLCHIPIQPAHIRAQTEPIPEVAEEAGEEAGAASETAQTEASDETAEESGEAQ